MEIYFDPVFLTVEVLNPSEIEAEVYIFDEYDTIEDHLPYLNSVLTVTQSFYHTIFIENDLTTGIVFSGFMLNMPGHKNP